MPDEVKSKIFDPFYTTKSRGTGLGLAVVQAVARAHQGEVWLDENYKDGSCFVMRLPTVQPSKNR
jgi:two-component system sensor histidine kinase FlrB